MTAVKKVTSMTGFQKKKTLEHNGCEFVKAQTATGALLGIKDEVWVCLLDGKQIAQAKLQIDCVNAAVEALGGE